MTKNELKAFRRALETRRTELRNGNKNREALAIDTSADQLERIQHANDRDCAVSNLERASDLLREVGSALRRIDAGTFGICAGCEEDINLKRLTAVPWASSCIVCQEAADRGQPTHGGELGTLLVMAA